MARKKTETETTEIFKNEMLDATTEMDEMGTVDFEDKHTDDVPPESAESTGNDVGDVATAPSGTEYIPVDTTARDKKSVKESIKKPVGKVDEKPVMRRAATRAKLMKPAESSVATNFYSTDFNETDRDLSPDQLKEWTAIYASFRSKTPLTGEVIGVDSYTLPVTDKEIRTVTVKQVLCLVVTHVDRNGECAVASRRLALGFKRNRFYRDRQNTAGRILSCQLLVVGPKRVLAECNGFDISINNRNLSYTAIADLREEYRTGQELPVKLIRCNPQDGTLEVSAKAVNPNPFDGADRRHPVNCTRKAVVSGSYAGGLFCRLADDTNCLCRYSPAYFDTEFFIGDTVLISVTKFDFAKKRMYGRILSRG